MEEMEPGGGRVDRLPSLEQELALAGEGAEARQATQLHSFYHSEFQHNISVLDPDPRICTFVYRIRILLFSSVTFKMPTKNNFFLSVFMLIPF